MNDYRKTLEIVLCRLISQKQKERWWGQCSGLLLVMNTHIKLPQLAITFVNHRLHCKAHWMWDHYRARFFVARISSDHFLHLRRRRLWWFLLCLASPRLNLRVSLYMATLFAANSERKYQRRGKLLTSFCCCYCLCGWKPVLCLNFQLGFTVFAPTTTESTVWVVAT